MNEVQPKIVESKAVWDAVALREAPDWLQRFDDQELSALRLEVDRCISVYGNETESIPVSEVNLGRARDRLSAIQDSLENGCGATLLRGLDIANYSDAMARTLFWLVATTIGTPVSQSAAGERIFAVQDAGFGESDRRARGPNTRKRLSFHTDRCDVIGFLCVRQAVEGGENDVISSAALYNRILERRQDLCRTLMQPYLYQRHNVDTANALPYCEQPIFSFEQGYFAANCLRVLIERAYASADTVDMTKQQREALDYLEETAEDATLYHRFRMEPGDMLFLNNWVTLHRRTEFIDAESPEEKRLLYRVWLSVPNSRPLDPRFAANYGDTEAGAVRGGMRSREPG